MFNYTQQLLMQLAPKSEQQKKLLDFISSLIMELRIENYGGLSIDEMDRKLIKLEKEVSGMVKELMEVEKMKKNRM
jgi:hypothetical protein